MAFCLLDDQVTKFKKAIADGTIEPGKMADMSSSERNKFLQSIVGEGNAKQVNSLFESKLLLKNQRKGLVNWAEQVAGIKEPARRDLISRIEKMDRVLDPKEGEQFLGDLASTKLGMDVTEEEAKNIMTLSKTRSELKSKVDPKTGVFASKDDRLKYGWAAVEEKEYIEGLKTEAGKLRARDFLTSPREIINSVAGATKSFVASLDNSFFGRQGIKTLYTNPDVWVKNFMKSWGDIGKELMGKDAMKAIKADIFSRPNALNNKYRVGKYDLGILTEEAFPSALPEKIPLFRRLYKASESAYNGAAMRMRADMADRVIATAEKNGINTLDKTQAESLGKLVNSLTGRGSIGKAEPLGKELNAALFSIKFLKSNFDTLSMHLLDKKMTGYAKKEAAKNLAKIVGSTAAVLGTASLMSPGSVDWDPRSSNFGKIKIGNTKFDVTGGMASLATLASRIIPTKQDGEWGFWTKSGTSGEYTKLSTGEYGTKTAMDVIDSFWQGKLSPTAGVLRDIWKGETYEGEKPTVLTEIGQVTKPIIISNYQELKEDPESANILAAMIADGLGISTNTYGGKADTKKETVRNLGADTRSALQKLLGTAPKESEEYTSIVNKITDEGAKITVPGSSTKIDPPGKEESRTMSASELKKFRELYKEKVKEELKRKENLLMRLTGDKFNDKLDEVKDDAREKAKDELIRSMR